MNSLAAEYRGNYVDIENNLVKIDKYFVDKVNLITAYQPDIYAFETVPSLKEVEIIIKIYRKRESLEGRFSLKKTLVLTNKNLGDYSIETATYDLWDGARLVTAPLRLTASNAQRSTLYL